MTWIGGVAEPEVFGRKVDIHRVTRDGETWVLLVTPDGCLRIPESLTKSLGTMLRGYKSATTPDEGAPHEQ